MRLSWSAQADPKSNGRSPSKRQRRRTCPEEKRRACEDGNSDRSDANSHQCLGKARNGWSPRAFQGSAGDTLILDLCLQNCREYSSVVGSHLLCANLLWRPLQTDTYYLFSPCLDIWEALSGLSSLGSQPPLG